MSDLRTLLADGLRPGVYRWQSDRTPEQVRRDVVAAGWDFVLLDTTEIHDKAGFLDLCATAFDLPRWFGRNWDALADCLGDPDWGPASPGRVILVNGWRHYAKARPDEWETAQEVLESAAGHYEEHDATLSVVLSLGGSDQLPHPGVVPREPPIGPGVRPPVD